MPDELEALRAEVEILRQHLRQCLLAARGEDTGVIDGWSPAVAEVVKLRARYEVLANPAPAPRYDDTGMWGDDPLLADARRVIALFPEYKRDELIHILQARFTIGWTRAARLMDEGK